MKKIAYTGLAFAFPLLTLAETVNSVQDLGAFVINLINNVAIPVLFAVAFLVFIYGVFKYFILGGSDAGKQKEGKSLMIYGIVGFFLMVSVWGLVRILTGTATLENNQPTFPKVNNIR